ncbi:hypothetical protein Tco_0102788 [Tanacetum coccineum]
MEVKKPEGVETSTKNIDKGIDAIDGVEARTSTTDKGKEKVSQDATEVVQIRISTVKIDSEIEYDSDDDSDYQSDKSVNYLSPREEELFKLRNRMTTNREEHDIYMNVLLKSLNIADKDGRTEDPFISVEKNVERYPMYDKTIHWRLRKPEVGEKYVSVAQYKDCLTYYALANGFSLWYESSGEAMVVAKCGQRKPRFSDPEKGKQRKQTRYPSGSSDELPTCPWRCYDRWMSDEKTFQCISLEDEHTCVRNFNFGSLVNYKWISKIFGDKIRANIDIRLCDIANLVMKKYKCKVDIGCEAIENRLSECFNSLIVNVRRKPLLTMLEDIRVIVLENMNKMREISRKWNPGVCPNIKKSMEWLKEQQRAQVRGERASGSRGGVIRSRGGASGSRGRGGAKGSRGGASIFREGVGGSRVVLVGLETQDELQQTQHEPVQTQDEDQVEQIEEQAAIDLTQVEQTQKQTQKQVQPQEQL